MEAHNLTGILLIHIISILGIQAVPYNGQQHSSCSGVKDGFYVNTGSGCKTYTYCHQGIADVFRCLPGTLFQEEENRCLPESSVTCDSAYRQEVQEPHNSVERESSSSDQIQKDLALLKQELERERAEEAERERQIKFRQLRDLLDTLKVTLDTQGRDDDDEDEEQRPPK